MGYKRAYSKYKSYIRSQKLCKFLFLALCLSQSVSKYRFSKASNFSIRKAGCIKSSGKWKVSILFSVAYFPNLWPRFLSHPSSDTQLCLYITLPSHVVCLFIVVVHLCVCAFVCISSFKWWQYFNTVQGVEFWGGKLSLIKLFVSYSGLQNDTMFRSLLLITLYKKTLTSVSF